MSWYSTVQDGIHTAIAGIPSAAALPLIDALDNAWAIERAREKGRRSLLLVYLGREQAGQQPLSTWTNNLVQRWAIVLFEQNYRSPADLLPLETIADDLLALRSVDLAEIGGDSVRLVLESSKPDATVGESELALVMSFRTTEFYA